MCSTQRKKTTVACTLYLQFENEVLCLFWMHATVEGQYLLQGLCDVIRHGHVTAHVEVTAAFHYSFVCVGGVVEQNVLHVHLEHSLITYLSTLELLLPSSILNQSPLWSKH